MAWRQRYRSALVPYNLTMAYKLPLVEKELYSNVSLKSRFLGSANDWNLFANPTNLFEPTFDFQTVE